jgi:hypothetical protein
MILTFRATTPLLTGSSITRRVYRWGNHIGWLNKTTKEWTAETRGTLFQHSSLKIESYTSSDRVAPPATVDDAWEETVLDQKGVQCIEGTLLQLRTPDRSKRSIEIVFAQALHLGIPSSTLDLIDKSHLIVEYTAIPIPLPKHVAPSKGWLGSDD